MDPITTDPNAQLTEADKIQARLQKGSPLIKKSLHEILQWQVTMCKEKSHLLTCLQNSFQQLFSNKQFSFLFLITSPQRLLTLSGSHRVPLI